MIFCQILWSEAFEAQCAQQTADAQVADHCNPGTGKTHLKSKDQCRSQYTADTPHTNQRDDKREAGVAQTTQGTGHDNRNAEQWLGNGNDAQQAR